MNRRRKRIWRTVLIIIFSVMTVVALTGYFLARRWSPILTQLIKDQVYTSTAGLYRVDFSRLSINLVTGNVHFQDFRLIPDTNVYNKLRVISKAPSYLFELSVDDILFRRIHAWKIYQEKAIDISEIRIGHPQIKVINEYQRKEDTVAASDIKNPYQLIQGLLTGIKVDLFRIDDIKFTYIQRRADTVKESKLEIKQLLVDHLNIDSASQFDTTRPFYADDIRVLMKNYSYALPDSLYTLEFSDCLLSTKSSSVEFSNFNYKPLYSEEIFAKRLGFRKERYDISMNELGFYGVDIKRLINYQKLDLKEMRLKKMDMNVYSNNRLEPRPDKQVRYPQEIIRRIKLPLYIQTIKLINSNINYSETDRNTGLKWNIDFASINGTIKDVSNDSLTIIKHPICKANLDAKLFSSKIRIQFLFDNIKKSNPFVCSGQISDFKFRKVNDILGPLTYIEASSGQLNRMDFNIKGDKKASKGKVVFKYEDLRIRVLRMDTENKRLKGSGFISMLANAMVVIRSNPSPNGYLREIAVNYTRGEKESFFSAIWRFLLKGMKESIGLDAKTEAEIRSRVSQVKSLLHQREAKKEMRLEKREERKEIRKARKAKRVEKSKASKSAEPIKQI